MPKNKKQIIIYASAAVLTVAVILVCVFLNPIKDALSGVPVLTVETPQKISITDKSDFLLDVSISDFGDAPYPAASFSVAFDYSRLEFLGIEEGNIFILDDAKADGGAQKLPEWSVNAEQSNKSGVINVMYLDMTGGKYAFTKSLLAEDDNVVFRLKFRLRGSARIGDVYELTVTDAVFASSDESKSLAMTTNTLRVKNSRIVVGE